MKRTVTMVWTLLVALVCVPLSAQIVRQTPQALVSTQLLVLVQKSMIGEGVPREDQLTRAKILLDMAVELRPEDPDVWLLEAELAKILKDEQGQIDALKRYLRLRGDDERAQLSLILGKINRMQTVDAKLEGLRGFFESGSARRLSAALRSRLAVYAATLAKEQGDIQRVASYLQLAMDLDEANGPAALMLYQFSVDHQANPLQLGAAATAAVRARPLDPLPRQALAKVLLSQGVYTRAAEQMDLAGVLLGSARIPTVEEVQIWSLALAGGNRSNKTLHLLENFEGLLKQQAALALEVAKESGETSSDIDPMQVSLPLDLELIRLMIYQSSTDSEQAMDSLNRLRQRLQDQASSGDQKARVDYYWIGAMFGFDLETIEKAVADLSYDDPLIRRAKGWLAVRRNDQQQAQELLGYLAEEDEFAAYGLTELLRPDPIRRSEALQGLLHRAPDSLIGTMAARELAADGFDVRPTPIGNSLVNLMDKFPTTLWELDLGDHRWIDLTLQVEPGRFGYLEPILAVLSIRNTAPFALGVGPDQTVPTQALISISPTAQGAAISRIPPLVAQLSSKLTLAPHESISTNIRLDQSLFGQIGRTQALANVLFNVTAIFDPRGSLQGLKLGPLGEVETVRALSIVGQGASPQAIELWLSQANGNDVASQMKALARLLVLAASGPPSDQEHEALAVYNQMIPRVATILNSQFDGGTPLRQAWIASFMQSENRGLREVQDDNPFQLIIDKVERSEDPIVRIMYLATQINEPESVALVSAMRSENTLIRNFSQALQQGLKIEAELVAAAKQEAEEAVSPQ